MVAEKDPAYRRSLKPLIFTSLIVIALIFIPLGYFQYQANRDREIENKILDAFANTPELAVYRLNVLANGNNLQLSGKLPNLYLRDRALQIASEATNKDLKSNPTISKINNNIYVVNIPPDPTLVAVEVQRLTKVLNYTQGVKIQSQFKNGQVIVTGEIEQPRLINTITQTYAKIAGVRTVTNATSLIPPKISTRIYFPFGVTNLPPQELEKLVEVKSFLDLYPDYSIKIYAKSDNVGERTINYQFSIVRIQVVRDALIKMGIKAKRLRSSGLIDKATYKSSEQMERWVEFEPTLR
jgi:outer membrane protein OmpA-like peptidoglycan-associated protein